jgi:thiamine-phosphate pyrophosphorylase
MSCSPEACCEDTRTPLPPGRKPILCYVTDRLALEAVSTPPVRDPHSGECTEPATRALLEAIRSAAAAGVDWIQIREKDLEARSLAALVRQVMDATRATSTRILVNDRLDVALAAGAAGVHLGEASLPVARVAEWRRSVGRTEFRLGVSCHSIDAARAAERGGADYLFFGPVFSTPSKATFGAPQGIERLREVCAAVRIPVLAIGGVDLENAASCMEAGAAGLAAIRPFQESQHIAARLREM